MTQTKLTYSDFKTRVSRGEVIDCEVGPFKITGQLKPAPNSQKPGALFVTNRVDDPQLTASLEAKNVEFNGTGSGAETSRGQIIGYTLIAALLCLFAMHLFTRGAGFATVSRSRARLVAESDINVNFSQVAGCEEAKQELHEVVDFLRHPARYQQMGAHIPRGVLLLGPPGTGKTLLARAVAGEAKVPFYSISGSDFVEMFVGVGASRVRDLFEQAKKTSPCIVFIDELDAVGRERGVRLGNSNDEREQTLNQLLVEMDGFAPNSGVILLAATNRPEILDRALLRPGRFDRRVVLDLPDFEGRLAILNVHSKGKPMAPSADLRAIARSTPGLSGADLANALNEAALMAARKQASQIEQKDLEQAVEKVVAGPERRTRRLSQAEKERVAYHEAGHALIAYLCEGLDPVRKVSIVPRGTGALGYTLQLPREDHYLATLTELQSRLRVLLAGRAAEEMVFHDVSTGAENDLERATALARQMVCLYGMNQAVGLAQSARKDSSFLQPDGSFNRDCSEETASLVDKEVRSMLDDFAREAAELLARHRTHLEKLATRLIQDEILEGDTLTNLLAQASVTAPACTI